MTARKNSSKTPPKPPQVKTYRVGNTLWDYPEGEQPEGAEEVNSAAPEAPEE